MDQKLTLPIIATLLSTAAYSQPQDMGTVYTGGNIGASAIDTDSVYLGDDKHPTKAGRAQNRRVEIRYHVVKMEE
ncbi:TPA: hypothetical protein ACX6SN_001075 [Photobacterium damselae]